ncbi:MAG TPA: porin family protein [Saprospiraceae bacterium]|nr:porin family protein [Saprospiraceae bacterium]
MKFFFLLMVSVILTTATINAQHVNIGLKAGLNVYNIHYDNDPQDDSRVGWYAGLLGHIHINPRFGIQPELIYSTQGSTHTFGGATNSTDLGYLNIPVMFQYFFDYGFRVQAGPQVGFLLSAQSESAGVSEDIKDQLAGVDFAIGLGLSYVHVPSGFGVDIRYNFGLTDISEEDKTFNAYNRGLQFGVFYLFNHRS